MYLLKKRCHASKSKLYGYTRQNSLVLVLSLSFFLSIMYACTKPQAQPLPQNGIMYAIEYNGNTQPAIYYDGTWVDPFTLDTVHADTYHNLTDVGTPTLLSND